MKRKLLEILCCPACQGDLALGSSVETNGDIEAGEFMCSGCGKVYPIIDGIPRFVEPDNYASSFGYQWNLFRKEQIDSHNGTTLSADRFWSETGWTRSEMDGKWVLDAGCGAGRFLDVASSSGGEIVGIDISNAVDAAKANLEDRENVHLVQASIYELPFKKGAFDLTYCIGVIQHTPDPPRTLSSIIEMVKPGGELAVTIYPRNTLTRLHSKYWFRPFTRQLRKETLLKLVQGALPVAFPITDVLFRIPVLGRGFMFTIPVANYVHERQLSRDQRYSWAVLDTFDMLSPQFDQPMTEDEARRILNAAGVESVSRLPNQGLNLVAVR